MIRGPLLASVLAIGHVLPGVCAESDDPAAPIKLSGYLEAGITANPTTWSDHKNFGLLTTDLANRPILNQASITVEKVADPALPFSVGFKAQGMYGSDARITHFLGVFEHTLSSRNQLDLVEGSVTVHTSLIGAGMDLKAGFYPTPLGAEVIDPSGNVFYSKSYVFNFGLPVKHSGLLTTTHLNATVDVYAGIDTGTNTTFGRSGDNNGAGGYILGIGLNGLAGGKVTVLAASHIGAETPRGTPGVRPNHDLRYYNDILITTKATDTLTLITELNYVRDDAFNASGWGLAQYAVYALTETLSLAGRAEVWRDTNGFFVAAFPRNFDFVDFQHGLATAMAVGGGRTTYGEFTVGVTWKPAVTAPFAGLLIRPELRYDSSLNGQSPFRNGTRAGQFTAAVDAIMKF